MFNILIVNGYNARTEICGCTERERGARDPDLLMPGYCLSQFYRGNIEIYSYGDRNISTIR